MKLPRLDYARPATVPEALALLRQSGGTARPIAGGQTLMPILAFRLAAPSLLVDLSAIPNLDTVRITDTGLHLGAMVRWAMLESNPAIRIAHPLLAEAVTHIAHWPIRTRGTVGGSLSHADPAAELPGIAVTCDAILHCEGPDGPRHIPAAQFIRGALTTALASDELLTEIEFPPFPATRRWAFTEFARRRGDFALAGVAIFWDPDAQGRIVAPHIGVIGAHNRPSRIAAAEQILAGQSPSESLFTVACAAFSAALDPPDDLHGTAAYRRALAGNLLHRALRAATERA
jgi:aerobic carbon-monoxide dehydrogenase medium subunit